MMACARTVRSRCEKPGSCKAESQRTWLNQVQATFVFLAVTYSVSVDFFYVLPVSRVQSMIARMASRSCGYRHLCLAALPSHSSAEPGPLHLLPEQPRLTRLLSAAIPHCKLITCDSPNSDTPNGLYLRSTRTHPVSHFIRAYVTPPTPPRCGAQPLRAQLFARDKTCHLNQGCACAVG